MSYTPIHDTSFEKISPSEVTVLVLNYNGSEDTIACLRALSQLDVPPLRTIVIDNASSDDSVKRIYLAWSNFAKPVIVAEKEADQLTSAQQAVILSLLCNGGYAAGNNAGIRLALTDAGCKAVWILNNDTEPQPKALSALCDRMNQEGTYALVGSTLIYAHDRKTVQCLAGSTVNKFLGTTQHIYNGMKSDCIPENISKDIENKIDFISGASLFVPAAVVKKIGMLNEQFFMYYEDVEYGIKSKRNGYKHLWSKNSIVYHIDGSSSSNKTYLQKKILNTKKWKECLVIQNRILFMRRNYLHMLPFVMLSYIWISIKKIYMHKSLKFSDISRSVYNGLTI